jgi:hypothetical protein
MTKKEEISQELNKLTADGHMLIDLVKNSEKFIEFGEKYQDWYTKALSAVFRLAPDRLLEFKSYYEIDPKRKFYRSSTYVIQDYIKGQGATINYATKEPDWDIHGVLCIRILGQTNILSSLSSRIDYLLENIETLLMSSFQDEELQIASELKKSSFRAAGALAGVILEAHLQRVAKSHNVSIGKAHPSISDLNDPLKNAGIYDTPSWRRIQFLGDIRNLCSHKKTREPIESEIDDLLAGVNWATKNIA